MQRFDHTLFTTPSFTVKDLATRMEAIQTPELQESARSFSKIIESTAYLLVLPIALLQFAHDCIEDTPRYIKAYMTLGDSKATSQDPRLQSLIKELRAKSRTDPEYKRRRDLFIDQHLDRFLRIDEFQLAARANVYAIMTQSWSALETVCKDVWIAALNARPILLGKSAFERIGSDSSDGAMSRKQISLGLLAQHQFDLRGCLGTVLASKFDFTSVSGIGSAYAAAFGGPTLPSWLRESSDPLRGDLMALEALRNLIAHRAGLVDAEFLRRTKRSDICGEAVSLTAGDIELYVGRVVEAGGDTVAFVDEWLRTHAAEEGTTA